MHLAARIAILSFCLPLLVAQGETLRNDLPLEQQLTQVPSSHLAKEARKRGDAKRGAVLFFKSPAGCVRCHSVDDRPSPLGPNLASLPKPLDDVQVIESLLYPSRKVSEDFRTQRILTVDGDVLIGLIADETDDQLTLRLPSDLTQETIVKQDDIEQIAPSETSLMPDGLVASLVDQRDFLDLARYIMELSAGGRSRAKELMPSSEQLAVRDDSINLDHAGIIKKLRSSDFRAGEKIYHGYCFNCHGNDGNTPSLQSARAFGTQQMKFGADPYRMFMTLTKGNGLMAPMSHLTPKERYQVVHYIREAFMKDANPAYFKVNKNYLDELPDGTENGTKIETPPRDRGPALASQLGRSVNSALTIDLMGMTISYNLHTMDQAGLWQNGFLDLSKTQHYRPRGEGTANPAGTPVSALSSWAWGHDGTLDYPTEHLNPRGPMPIEWMQYRGHHLHDHRVVLSYSIDHRMIDELPQSSAPGVVRHRLKIQPGNELILCAMQDPTAATAGSIHDNVVYLGSRASAATAVLGDRDGCLWTIDRQGRVVLTIPKDTKTREIEIVRSSVVPDLDVFRRQIALESGEGHPFQFDSLANGGPALWDQVTETCGYLGLQQGAYKLDTVTIPDSNPFNSWMRTSAIDFFDDGRMVVTTYGGDVWVVSGVDEEMQHLRWRRFAAGLYEPMGVKVVDGRVHVTCKDRLVRLHDLNGNGEADFYESLSADVDVSPNFHAFNFDLQVDTEGNFYYAKSGHGGDSAVPGQVVKISPDGQQRSVYCTGFRTPNGMGVLPDGRVTASDNQGQWTPASKISLLKPGGFYGWVQTYSIPGMWEPDGGKIDIKEVVPPKSFDPPMIWMPQEFDSSSGGQLFVDDDRFGPLSHRLFHTSFGKGWMYYMMMQDMGDVSQAAIIKLPFNFRTGVMRAAVNPADGQVYATGLQGWNGGGRPGLLENGIQRLRFTEEPFQMVSDCKVTPQGLRISFNFPLDRDSASSVESFQVRHWNYHWRAEYGSDMYSPTTDESGAEPLVVSRVQVGKDGSSVTLVTPDLKPVHQVHIILRVKDETGQPFEEEIYWTINRLPSSKTR